MFKGDDLKPVPRSEAFSSSSSSSSSPTATHPHPALSSYSSGNSSSSSSDDDGDRTTVSKRDKSPPTLTYEYEERGFQHGAQQQEDEIDPLRCGDGADSQTYTFRLFASAHAQKPRAHGSGGDGSAERAPGGFTRVNIRSPTPASAGVGGIGGGFLVPSRSPDYYFTGGGVAEERKRREYDDVAVEGWEVVSWARSISWPGAALPWRVIHVPPTAVGLASAQTVWLSSAKTTGRKRVRAGKKRRIVIRKKHVAQVKAAETEREKRSRKNREKKLKKREKNRMRKKEHQADEGSARDPDQSIPV